MRPWMRLGIAGTVVATGAAFLLAVTVTLAAPQTAAEHVTLVGSTALGSADAPPAIPPDSSTWIGEYPYAPRHQDGFEDNGDGILSVGDQIRLDGVWYPIGDVRPAYVVEGGCYVFPAGDIKGRGVLVAAETPPGQEPAFAFVFIDRNLGACLGASYVAWMDVNENGVVDEGDVFVTINPHGFDLGLLVTDIWVAIQIDELAVSTQVTTWSRVKALFR